MSRELKDIQIFWGMLTDRIYMGFRSKYKTRPNSVTSSVDVTDMVLVSVASMLLKGDKDKEGSIYLHAEGKPGPLSIIISARYANSEEIKEELEMPLPTLKDEGELKVNIVDDGPLEPLPWTDDS